MSESLEFQGYNSLTKLEEINKVEEANWYLKNGWKLLKVLEVGEQSKKTPLYVLGWFLSGKPVYPEEIKPSITKFHKK